MNWQMIGFILGMTVSIGFGFYSGATRSNQIAAAFPLFLVAGFAAVGLGVGVRFVFDLLTQ